MAFAPATEGVLAKLGRVLPDALRESMRTVEDVVAVEPGPWTISTSAEYLVRAATAIRMCQRVRFEYRAGTGACTSRRIDPYGVLHTDGRWYLIGYCHTRKDTRMFRLDRVSHLEACEETFAPPAEFNAKEWLQERMHLMQSEYQIDVWIDMPFAEAEQTFGPWRVAIEAEGGGTRLRCGRDRLDHFAGMLLSVGCGIVVRAPEELRGTFEDLARRALQAAAAI